MYFTRYEIKLVMYDDKCTRTTFWRRAELFVIRASNPGGIKLEENRPIEITPDIRMQPHIAPFRILPEGDNEDLCQKPYHIMI